MNKKKLIKKRLVIGSLIIISILCMTQLGTPVIYGSNTINIIENKKENYLNSYQEISDFIDSIIELKDTVTFDIVFDDINNYLKDTKSDSITKESFTSFCECLKNELGEEEFLIFLSILHIILENSNNNVFQLFYKYLVMDIRFKNEINGFLNNPKMNPTHKQNIDNYENQNSIIGNENNQENFVSYWQWYEKGKKIWAGNFVNKDGEFITTPILAINWWKGENFSDWYYQAADFIWGIEGVTQFPQFRLINTGLSIMSYLFFIIAIIGYLSGLMGSDAGFEVGGLFGIFSVALFIILLFWDWYILLYFLFGTNAFLMMLEWGNVDFFVELKGDKSVIDNCEIKAASINAEIKYDETNGNFDRGVTWSLCEFEYTLHSQEEMDYKENTNYYSISYPEYVYDDADKNTAHKQWQKAVPPSGDWRLSVIDESGNILDEKIIGNTKPRNCYHVTFDI